jgi:hypothetical protein
MMTAPRKALAAALQPILPKGWALIDSSRSVDRVEKVRVQLFQRSITRLPAAPIGKHYVGFIVEISVGEQGMERAEDTLDDQISDLIHAMDGLGIGWTNCEKFASPKTKRLGYQITLNLISSKE